MEENYIPNPRAMFDKSDLGDKKEGTERFVMGGKSSGIVFDVTNDGVEVNGYYEGFNIDTTHANMLKSIFISWEELDKMRYMAEHKDRNVPDIIDNSPDEEYLSILPIVHLNGREYYIDSVKRERRMVSNPKNVYKF